MAYFRQDGAMHGWNGRDGYKPAAPITRVICDICATIEVTWEPARERPDGDLWFHQSKPWKWAPWAMGQPCDGCGMTDDEVRHAKSILAD